MRPQDLLADGQQGSELVAGCGPIPRLTRPVGQVAARAQGARMLRA